MRHIFIINPAAGKGRHMSELSEKISTELARINPEIYITKGRGDAKLFARETAKFGGDVRFYACGGDGTINEVASGIIGFENTQLVPIPCGSGNDFIKNFEDCDIFSNIAALEHCEVSKIDVVKINDEYAINIGNLGFDADVSDNMGKFKKLPFVSGKMSYNLSLAYCMFKKLGKKLSFLIDGETKIEGEFLLSVFANGTTYGGGFMAAPYAILNDGKLDFCAIRKISRFKILEFVKLYKQGKHIESESLRKYVTFLSCKKVTFFSKKPISICMDGENVMMDGEITVEIVPACLNIARPVAGVLAWR